MLEENREDFLLLYLLYDFHESSRGGTKKDNPKYLYHSVSHHEGSDIATA